MCIMISHHMWLLLFYFVFKGNAAGFIERDAFMFLGVTLIFNDWMKSSFKSSNLNKKLNLRFWRDTANIQ